MLAFFADVKQFELERLFLQYMPGVEVLACSLNTNLNYVITMLQLHPSLNHYVKLWQLLGEDVATFWAYSQRQICSLSSTLSWTQGLLLNFQQNA